MKYVSRKYLKEKWEALKWDMEKVVDVYGNTTEEDQVDPEDVRRCAANIIDKCESIMREIG